MIIICKMFVIAPPPPPLRDPDPSWHSEVPSVHDLLGSEAFKWKLGWIHTCSNWGMRIIKWLSLFFAPKNQELLNRMVGLNEPHTCSVGDVQKTKKNAIIENCSNTQYAHNSRKGKTRLSFFLEFGTYFSLSSCLRVALLQGFSDSIGTTEFFPSQPI